MPFNNPTNIASCDAVPARGIVARAMEQISLNHEASAGDTHKQTVSELPVEVVQCLENARFVRLNSPQPVLVLDLCPSLTS